MYPSKLLLAEKHFKKSLEALGNTWTKNLPVYAEILGNLGRVYHLQEKVDEAWELAEKSASVYVDSVDKIFTYTSEKDKIMFLRGANIDYYTTIALKKISEPIVREKLFLRTLQYKNNTLH